jgi:hypothetical protein
MTSLQLGLLLGLVIISLLAAFFPRRLARPRKSPDPFVELEVEWREIMQVRPRLVRSSRPSAIGAPVPSFSPEKCAA